MRPIKKAAGRRAATREAIARQRGPKRYVANPTVGDEPRWCDRPATVPGTFFPRRRYGRDAEIRRGESSRWSDRNAAMALGGHGDDGSPLPDPSSGVSTLHSRAATSYPNPPFPEQK